jgi:hypothetical protein
MPENEQNGTNMDQVIEAIYSHRKLEDKQLQRNDKILAVGFSYALLDGQPDKFWLTNKENVGGYRPQRTITGNFIGTETQGITTVTTDGKVVYKNTRLGEQIIRNAGETTSYSAPIGVLELMIKSLTTFTPNPHNSDAADLTVRIGKSKAENIASLSYYLNEYKNNQAKKELESTKLETLREEQAKVNEDRRQQFEAEILEQERKLQALERNERQNLDKARSFIRKHVELRHQPILDPWQEEVKRSHVFDGTVAIDGGPGTGKTTSLIQRIKFLTDKRAMLGDPDANEIGYLKPISTAQSNVLFAKNNWIFFSPSELLKLFLRNSMIQEGLQADDSSIHVWDNFRSKIIKDYKFINTETRNPFLVLNKFKNECLFPVNGNKLKPIISRFEEFFLEKITDYKFAEQTINESDFIWSKLGLKIRDSIQKNGVIKSYGAAFKLFFSLQKQFAVEANTLKADYDAILTKSSVAMMVRIKKLDNWNSIYTFISEWIQDNQNSDDEDDNDIDEDDIEEEVEKLPPSSDVELFLSRRLKVLIAKEALSKYDSRSSLSKKQKELSSFFEQSVIISSLEKFDRLAQIAFFNKYYLKLTTGPLNSIVRRLPTIYKAFRINELKESKHDWNYQLLKHLVEDDAQKNKRIHPQEQSFLLYTANILIKESYKNSRLETDKFNHPYFQSFRNIAKPVIGIDEATDFHLIDLLAMHSLGHHEINSVTLSGDLMQRLTEDGIRDWHELSIAIKDISVQKLQVSYRQSPTLLDVASKIYTKATGKEADYISFQDRDEFEPAPLLFLSDSDEEKIEWLSNRINEIYKAYGSFMPSIAIFLPSEDKIELFARSLGEKDILADIGINVVACNKGEILGDKNSVRVFSIDYVKGLEFEAAFFHNIDRLYSSSHSEQRSNELILKNIYVGLSRASHYMGVTASNGASHLEFIKDIFETEHGNWK